MTAELIDTHVHVWDPALHRYPWLEGLEIHRPMLPVDVDRGDGTTTAMVFVQAGASPADALAEAQWVYGLDWPELVAIVADADLRAAPDAVAVQLDTLAAIPRVTGIRHLVQDEDAATFAALRPGLEAVAARGLVFDAGARHAQLEALADLLESVPELVVVLNHLGKPPVDDGPGTAVFESWALAMDRLAARSGTYLKISGLTAESSDPAAFARNADAVISRGLEAFGPSRSMIGSDWPVSATFGVGGSFADWVARVRRAVVDGFGEEAWADVASGTARRVYLRER